MVFTIVCTLPSKIVSSVLRLISKFDIICGCNYLAIDEKAIPINSIIINVHILLVGVVVLVNGFSFKLRTVPSQVITINSEI